MTFLKLKFDFLKKVEYIFLYNKKINIFLLFSKIRTNFFRLHCEKNLVFDFIKKYKNINILILIINKNICYDCKKKYFLYNNFIYKNKIKLIFNYKKKKMFFGLLAQTGRALGF